MSAPILPLHKKEALAQALTALQAGQLIIIPTDTVYGIACWPQSQAITRLYQARQREPEPALPLLLAHSSLASEIAYLTPLARRLIQQFWPGPLTLVLPARANLKRLGFGDRVGLRQPAFPALWPLLEACGGYLVVSSAKRPGDPPALTAAEAAHSLGDEVALILDGGAGPYGLPSTIVDCTQDSPLILRRGSVAEADLLKAFGSG